MDSKCECQHCGGQIVFATEQAGQDAICPHCGKETRMEIPSAPSPKFFVWQNEQQQGPFEWEEIVTMIKEGQITRETLVCPEDGGLDWTPAVRLFLGGWGDIFSEYERKKDSCAMPAVSYRHDKARGDSLVEIRLTSGAELKIKSVRLFNLAELRAIDAQKTEARQLNQGVSTGLGSFGSLGWVLASSVVIGAVDGALSSNAISQGTKLLIEASRMETELRNEGFFLPVGAVKNIEHPFPENWICYGNRTSGVAGNIKAVATIFAHNGNDFVTVQTDDGSVRSIRWSTVESYAYDKK